ncbi:MAG: hypothetical protein K0R31_914 [Clostridiales bacterium]|jgi:hypothetical protein|nr:hypothetical protein [Clostridiales bacterium]
MAKGEFVMANIIIPEGRTKRRVGLKKKTNVIRSSYAVLFFLTTFVNLNLAISSPEVIGGLSETAWVPYLGDMIAALPVWVYALSLYCLAVYQFILSMLLIFRGVFVQLGMLGAVAFFLFIQPFGIFSLPVIPLIIPLLLLVDVDYECSIPGLIKNRMKR